MAYIKDIDDTKLHDFIWYPKDIVEYARKKFASSLKEEVQL